MQERLRKGDTFQKVLHSKNSHNSKQTFIEELYLDAAKETLFSKDVTF